MSYEKKQRKPVQSVIQKKLSRYFMEQPVQIYPGLKTLKKSRLKIIPLAMFFQRIILHGIVVTVAMNGFNQIISPSA